MRRLIGLVLVGTFVVGCSSQSDSAKAPANRETAQSNSPSSNADHPAEAADAVKEPKANGDKPSLTTVPDRSSKDVEADQADSKPKKDAETQPAPQPSVAQLLQQAGQSLQGGDFKSGIATLRQILEKDPDHRRALAGFVQATQQQAFALIEQGNRDEGYKIFFESAKHARHLAMKHTELITAEKQLLIQALYNDACAYALVGNDKEKALKSLREAVDAGFSDRKLLNEDPDLNLIRDTEEFKEIAGRLEPKEQPKAPEKPDDQKADPKS